MLLGEREYFPSLNFKLLNKMIRPLQGNKKCVYQFGNHGVHVFIFINISIVSKIYTFKKEFCFKGTHKFNKQLITIFETLEKMLKPLQGYKKCV